MVGYGRLKRLFLYGMQMMYAFIWLSACAAAPPAPTPVSIVVERIAVLEQSDTVLIVAVFGRELDRVNTVMMRLGSSAVPLSVEVVERQSARLLLRTELTQQLQGEEVEVLFEGSVIGAVPLAQAPTPTAPLIAPTTSNPTILPTLELPQVTDIQPPEISLSQTSSTITLEGRALDRLDVNAITLVTQLNMPVDFKVEQQSATSITLRLGQFALDRASIVAEVRVNQMTVGIVTLLSGNPAYEVVGVFLQYAYTGRVDVDAKTTLLAEPAGSTVAGVLRNGDLVEVIDGSVDGWFLVQVLEGESSGLSGWVERWLVLNANVPPPGATPVIPSAVPSRTPALGATQSPTAASTATRTFEAIVERHYPGVQAPAGSSACVGITVFDRRGMPLAGAEGTVSDGNSPRFWRTNNDGFVQVCNLGFGQWIVSLSRLPSGDLTRAIVLQAPSITSVSLSGAPTEQALVRFDEQ